MIVKSKITGKDYFWVSVPKTATMSYSHLFFGCSVVETEEKIVVNTHSHWPYVPTGFCLTPLKYNTTLDGFALVRNPYDKFISGLKFLYEVLNHNQWDTIVPTRRNDPNKDSIVILKCPYCNEEHQQVNDYNFHSELDLFKNENNFYSIMYDIFGASQYTGFLNDIISPSNKSWIPSIFTAVFTSQLRFAYHPRVKIFKYENIGEYNTWIENTLGYDTSKLQRLNKSNYDIPIDTTTTKFKELVEYLFYDDFKVFGYEL